MRGRSERITSLQLKMVPLDVLADGVVAPILDAFAAAGSLLYHSSISMACDSKQALDLLGMPTPDAVLVDLRTSPEAAAPFLEALALENGRTPTFLVCGDAPDTTLRRALDPLLRETPLDAAQLAKVCQTILTPPTPEAARTPQSRVVRPLDRKTTPTPAARKPVRRRVLTKRR